MGDRFTTRRATLQRHKQQTCKVYSVKIDQSHLSVSVQSHLASLFREAKWFYNYCLSHDNINDADTTARQVPVKVKDKYEDRTFTTLQAHMKQGIKTRLFGSLSSLHTLKENGHKVGKLKFKSVINSIPLKEYKRTYFLDIVKNRIRIQGLKKWLRVRGLRQIPVDAEIANAVFVRKNDDYYLNITTYTNQRREVPETSVGIDFGCETQLSLSNGVKVQFQVPASKRLKRLDRKIMKCHRKDSKNKEKDKAKRRIEYEYLTNCKKDIRCKLVNAIVNNYKYVCFQNESIHAWSMSNHGKKIQSTGIGGILADLKHKAVTPIEIDKFFPSTQLCPECSSKNKLGLSERTYICGCGYSEDRDVKSALCIEAEGMKQRVPMDYREFKPGEISTSTFFDTVSKITGVKVSKLKLRSQEAAGLALR